MDYTQRKAASNGNTVAPHSPRMKVTRPNEQPMTPEDRENLEKLRIIIAWAIADGRVSKQELEHIKAQMYANRKVTSYELEILREEVLAKIQSGELEWEWD